MKEVTLTFKLEEEVTPELFLEKIAAACARGGALRKGESVWYGDAGIAYLYDKQVPSGVVGKFPITVPGLRWMTGITRAREGAD